MNEFDDEDLDHDQAEVIGPCPYCGLPGTGRNCETCKAGLDESFWTEDDFEE